jgi:DNA relaxase NicK
LIRFDAYSATTTAAKHPELMSLLAGTGGPGQTMKHGKGFHTFGDRIGVTNDSGVEWASVQWGGGQGERTMIEVKGESTPAVVEALRSAFPHRCTRVDSCADFDVLGAFERLYGEAQVVKKDHRLKGEKQGDWDDFPEDGRTLYLGARSSTCRLRLYEKGKQPEYRHLERPNWARIELQVRPAKEAKSAFSALSAAEVWGASTWTRELAAKVLQEHIDPHPAGTTYRLTQRDAALEWMCHQYGVHLLSLANDLGGWDCLGRTLQEIIHSQKRKARKQ